MTEAKRKGYSTIEQQMAADRRYREKNKERRNYLSSRSTARSFIRNKTTIDDLEELQKLINERKNSLLE